MDPIFAAHALTSEGWCRDVEVAVEDGRIVSVRPDTTPAPGATRGGGAEDWLPPDLDDDNPNAGPPSR